MQTHRLPPSDALGFSIHNERYPVIALNGSDWPRRKTFTLFHELAHLSIGAGGICDLHDVRTSDPDTETYCNQVAAAALLPPVEFRAAAQRTSPSADSPWELEALAALAGHFGASQEATLLRLVTLDIASWDDYWRLKPELDERYREAWEQERQRMREADGGPSYYVLHARNLGRRYTNTVLDAYHAEAISSLDVATYLRVRYQNLPKLEAVA